LPRYGVLGSFHGPHIVVDDRTTVDRRWDVDWLLLAALGIIWVAFLLPSGRRASPAATIEEFEKSMDRLADTDGKGRWVMAPPKGAIFMGAKARQRAVILERRRRLLTFLLQGTGLTFLIGLVPPLHGMWVLTMGFGVVLVGYCWMLLRLRAIETHGHHGPVTARPPSVQHRVQETAGQGYATGQRYVADHNGRVARSSYAGLAAVTEDDVHVIVHVPDRL